MWIGRAERVLGGCSQGGEGLEKVDAEMNIIVVTA